MARVRGGKRTRVFLVGTLLFDAVRSQCLKVVLLLSHIAWCDGRSALPARGKFIQVTSCSHARKYNVAGKGLNLRSGFRAHNGIHYDFRAGPGTEPPNPGLSREFRDSWHLCSTQTRIAALALMTSVTYHIITKVYGHCLKDWSKE